LPHLSFVRAALVGATIGAAGVVFAQQSDDSRTAQIDARFKLADKDGDGKLTQEEAKAGMPRVAKHFDQIDKDKLGYVTLDQIKAAAATMAR
jgi:Ca2+-binding EF-hand superfamily protein